jgi:hypothetical protein
MRYTKTLEDKLFSGTEKKKRRVGKPHDNNTVFILKNCRTKWLFAIINTIQRLVIF